jgi:hypothetical protein
LVWFLCCDYGNASNYGQEGSNIIGVVGQPTSGGPPAWGLDEMLTTPHRKKLPCYETFNPNQSKFHLRRNEELIEVSECLLSFGAESFVFQFAIQKFQD